MHDPQVRDPERIINVSAVIPDRDIERMVPPFDGYPLLSEFVSQNHDEIDEFSRHTKEEEVEEDIEESDDEQFDKLLSTAYPNLSGTIRVNRENRRQNNIHESIDQHLPIISNILFRIRAKQSADGQELLPASELFTGTLVDPGMIKALDWFWEDEKSFFFAEYELIHKTGENYKEKIETDEEFLTESAQWLREYIPGKSHTEDAVYYIVVNDFYRSTEAGRPSLANTLFKEIQERVREEGTSEVAIQQLIEESPDSPLGQWIRFIGALTHKSDPIEISTLINNNQSLVPFALSTYISDHCRQTILELKSRLESSLRFYGKLWYLDNPTTFEKAKFHWLEVISRLPSSAIVSQQVRSQVALRKRRRNGNSETKIPSLDIDEGIKPETNEVNNISRKFVVLRKNRETGHFASNRGVDESDESLEEFVSSFALQEKLDEESISGIYDVMLYLEKTKICEGVKVMSDHKIVLGLGSQESLRQLKPKDIPGIKLPQRIKDRLRIEFILMPDGNVGLLGMFFRDDTIGRSRRRRRR